MIDTTLSTDRMYRYALARRWTKDADPKYVNFILLNPSTADEFKDDPTIRRCIGFAKREGFSAMVVTNLFALRATNPKALRSATDPVGPMNSAIVGDVAAKAGLIILGWGSGGEFWNQGSAVCVALLASGLKLWAFGFTKLGQPKHPLYLSATTPLCEVQP